MDSRVKTRKRLAKEYLKVQRQREDFARKRANAYLPLLWVGAGS
jgi:hypothetical protein